MTTRRNASPRLTFGIIVLNGEPFTRYNLRALYPFAHQIIIAEGAAPAARSVARADGHSRDGTLEVLRQFKGEEDPDDKVTIVVAEEEGHPDGFWPGEKHEQSQAYARRATGDYLWQVDIDEFYLEGHVERVLAIIQDDPSIDAMTFQQLTFWGGLDYTVDGFSLRRGAGQYHRFFKWGPGYAYTSHRPPTVTDALGNDLRQGHWLTADETTRLGIRLMHYSLLFPKQVREKSEYYAAAPWAQRGGALEWADTNFGRLGHPYAVHNLVELPSWLERYKGPHPKQVELMLADIQGGRLAIDLRDNADVERLLNSRQYLLGTILLKVRDHIERRWLNKHTRATRVAKRARNLLRPR